MSVSIIHNDTGDILDWGQPGLELEASGEAGSTVEIVGVGEVEVDEETFGFSGMHGQFSACHGTRGRTITIAGALRLSASGFATVQASIDDWRRRTGTFMFIDDDQAGQFDNCRFDPAGGFVLGTKRRIASDPLIWLIPYTIKLEQMEV